MLEEKSSLANLNFEALDEATVVRNISTALSFLLHKDSPRWNEDNFPNPPQNEAEFAKIRFESLIGSKAMRKLAKDTHELDRRCSEVTRLVESIQQSLPKHSDGETISETWKEMLSDWKNWILRDNTKDDRNASAAKIIESSAIDPILIDESKDDIDIPNVPSDNPQNAESYRFVQSVESKQSFVSQTDGTEAAAIVALQTQTQLRDWLSRREITKQDSVLTQSQKNMDITNTLMRQWGHKQVVSWLQSEGYYELAKTFGQQNITGAEFRQMGWKQIQLMYNAFKSSSTQEMTGEKAIEIVRSKEKYVVEIRSKYGYQQMWGIVVDINDHDLITRAQRIRDVVELLRVSKRSGPFDFWADKAIFVDKIDNWLMVLLMQSDMREKAKGYFEAFPTDGFELPPGTDAIGETGNLTQDDIDAWWAKLQKLWKPASYASGKEIIDWITSVDNRPNADRKSAIEIAVQLLAHNAFFAYDAATAAINEFVDKTTALYTNDKSVLDEDELNKSINSQFTRSLQYQHSVWNAMDGCNYAQQCCAMISKYMAGIFICLVIFSGCIGNILYWSHRSDWQIESVMKLAIDGVTGHHSNGLENAASAANSVLGIVHNGLNTGDIIADLSNANGSYDRFFAQIRDYVSAQSISGVYMYNNDSDFFFGVTRNGNALDLVESQNGCLQTYSYDSNSEERISNSDNTCSSDAFYPRTRTWFTLAAEGSAEQYQWTNTYDFAESDDIGLTLATRVEYQGSTVIFIVDMIATQIQSRLQSLGVPLKGVVYLAMNNYDVIASSVGDTHYSAERRESCSQTCTSSDGRLVNTINYLLSRDEFASVGSSNESVSKYRFDNYQLAVSSIPITQPFNGTQEYYHLVVVYTQSYKDALVNASTASWIVSVLILIVAGVAMFVVYSANDTLIDELSAEIEAEKVNATDAIENVNVKINAHKALDKEAKALDNLSWWAKVVNAPGGAVAKLITTFQVTIVLLTLIIYIIWNASSQAAYAEIMEEILLKEQYFSIQDQVIEIFETSETIIDIVSERFNRGDFNLSDVSSMDAFFSSTVNSFKDLRGTLQQNGLYIGLPDGGFVGAFDYGEPQLTVEHRGESTNWILMEVGAADGGFPYYDPRCRSWYKSTVQYTFNGTLEQAFPDGLDVFKNTSTLAFETTECNTDAVNFYDTLFNVSSDGGSDVTLIATDKVAWSKYLFEEGMLGLTASAAVHDQVTGNLLAVAAIDYTLQGFCEYVNGTIALTDKYNSEWYSWLFEAGNLEMVASSDFKVASQAANVEGCLQFEATDEFVEMAAMDHPTDTIKLMSEEVIQVHGVSNLEINGDPSSVRVPSGYPYVEAGRAKYGGDAGVDWVIVNAISVDYLNESMDSDQKLTALVAGAVVLCFLFLLQSLKQSIEIRSEDIETDTEFPLPQLLDNFEPLVRSAAEQRWKEAIIDENHWGPVSMTDMRQFCSNRAKDYIKTAQSKAQFFDDCLMEATQQWNKLTFVELIRSFYYNCFIYIVLIGHCVLGFVEPASPKQLISDGLSNVVRDLTIVCVLIEWIDFALVTAQRYFTFDTRQSSDESEEALANDFIKEYVFEEKVAAYQQWFSLPSQIKKSVFVGSGWLEYNFHFIFLLVITINFITMAAGRTAVFSYFIPIVPLLLINRCPSLSASFKGLFHAIRDAYDVLFMFLCTVAVAAAIGLAIFRTTLNTDQASNTFESFTRAIVTTFIYLTTADNFDDTVYPAREISEFNLIFFFALVVVGLFVLVPIIINRFEQSFIEEKVLSDKLDKRQATNTLIAAFSMLDLDNNGTIERKQFESLLNLSEQDLWDALQMDGVADDGSTDKSVLMSLGEFRDVMSVKELFETVAVENAESSFWQSWLETHIVRPDAFRRAILCCAVFPAITCALIYGLTGAHSSYLDVALLICFIINALEILVRFVAYGWKRFFGLHRYNDPPFVEAATLIWRRERGLEDNKAYVSLSRYDWKKAEIKLNPIPPLSLVERKKLSLVNVIEFVLFFAAAIGAIIFWSNGDYNYGRMCLQASTFRLFTQIMGNREIIYVLWTVLPQFLSFVSVAGILTFFWARVGCTLFSETTDVVLDQVYDSRTDASFDTLAQSMMALLQLVVGESVSDMLYENLFATDFSYAWYFAAYIVFMSTIVVNIFIGLVLAAIREFKEEQSQSSIISESFDKSHSQFKATAVAKRNEHLEMIRRHNHTVEKIDRAIRRSAKRTKSKHGGESDKAPMLSNID